MKNISILGCGWLGFPLAQKLLQSAYAVKGSTTSAEKMKLLENSGIAPFLISLETDAIHGKIDEFLSASEILIIDIPPKLGSAEAESFVSKINFLIPYIEKARVDNVIFISSTAVYADDDSIITEATKAIPETESGKQLLETEAVLQKNPNFKTTVLRFGGLIGEDRHPVRFLAGRENIDHPDAPINLIHQEDCIGIILKIIATDCWNEVFNAVAPFHPSRRAYYSAKAFEMMLPMPKFSHEKASVGKTISSEKTTGMLGYQFRFPTL